MARNNPGERVLGPRKTTRGARDALENLIGAGLLDGAQCYVTEEQATYRFIAQSTLAADGRFVVAPLGGQGRWVRESGGLVGFALCGGGVAPAEPHPDFDGLRVFTDYSTEHLVQFEREGPQVRYVGAAVRQAFLIGNTRAPREAPPRLLILVAHGQQVTPVAVGDNGQVVALTHLFPRDAVFLATPPSRSADAEAAHLTVVLVG